MSIATLAASGHISLADDVLSRPEAVSINLWRYLASKDALPQGSRVWMRPCIPWQEPLYLPDALSLARAAPSSLRCFTGVVTAVSAGEEAAVSRTYVCSQCGSQERILGDEYSSGCCGSSPILDFSLCTIVPAQTILLAPATSTCCSTHGTLFSPVAVRLRDDLVGLCYIGDIVQCTGIAHCILDPKLCGHHRRPCLADIKMDALDCRVLTAAHLHLPSTHQASLDVESLQQPPGDMDLEWSETLQKGEFSTLLGNLKDWLHPPCSQLAQIALLLSASAAEESSSWAGQSKQDEDIMEISPEFDALGLYCTRPERSKRVNVLLLTGAHDSAFENTMRSAAQGLCPHTTDSSLPGSSLLPSVLSLPGMPPLATSGQLGQANAGVCLLTSGLSLQKGRALGEALRSGQADVALPLHTKVVLPVQPTVWCTAAALDLLKQDQQQKHLPSRKKWKKDGRSVEAPQRPLAAAFAEKFSPQLAAQFDIVIDCCSCGSNDREIEAWADEFFDRLLVPKNEQQQQLLGEKDRLGTRAKRSLRALVTRSRGLPPPQMTPSAMNLLSGYWSAFRSSLGEEEGAAAAVSLECAARLAAGSARLFHRREIHAFPDATLAVAFCEEALIAWGWRSFLWGPLREDMAGGSGMDECLSALYDRLKNAAKAGGWDWELNAPDANEE